MPAMRLEAIQSPVIFAEPIWPSASVTSMSPCSTRPPMVRLLIELAAVINASVSLLPTTLPLMVRRPMSENELMVPPV